MPLACYLPTTNLEIKIFVVKHSNSGTVAYGHRSQVIAFSHPCMVAYYRCLTQQQWNCNLRTQESGDCIFPSLHGCLLQVSDPLLYEPVPKGAPSDISICGLTLILMVWPTLQRTLWRGIKVVMNKLNVKEHIKKYEKQTLWHDRLISLVLMLNLHCHVQVAWTPNCKNKLPFWYTDNIYVFLFLRKFTLKTITWLLTFFLGC